MPHISARKFHASTGEEIYRPVIPVTVIVGTMGVNAFGIVDSGADDTLVPAEIVATLGVDYAALQAGTISIGAGSSKKGFDARPCDGTVGWDKYRICDRFKVAPPASGLDFVLLGRKEFFSKFVIKFHWYKDPPVFDIDPAANPAVQQSPRKPKRGR